MRHVRRAYLPPAAQVGRGSFLLDLASRWAVRGYSSSQFDLCLTRKEIGSYLGLTFETVSRTLSYFDSREWIDVAGREIRIRDREALQEQQAAG